MAVELTGLQLCGGYRVYTHYQLRGVDGPSGFEESFPCLVSAGGYVPSPAEAASSSCSFHGLKIQGDPQASLEGAAFPGTEGRSSPPRGSLTPGFCRLQWTGWGGSTTDGTGVLRNSRRQWGVKLELSHTGWCNELGIAYTRLRVERYGPGELIPNHESILTRRTSERLRGQIGRRGVVPHAFEQTESTCIYG